MENKVIEIKSGEKATVSSNSLGIRCRGCGALLLTLSLPELKLIEEIRQLGWGQIRVIEVRAGQPRLVKLGLEKIIKLD